MSARGFFAIGICNNKSEVNIGSLWRSANLYGAAFVFTVGARYRRQCSDTMRTPAHVPLFHFADLQDLIDHLPHSCPLIGVELAATAQPLVGYMHPERAAYLLGAEDHGLTRRQAETCHQLVQIEAVHPGPMNVAVAGSIVMHHRHTALTLAMAE